MAKKKDKPQVINNIQEINLEIDYDKLAEAIVKAQEKTTASSESKSKIGFWKTFWLIIRNKEPKNGEKTAYLLAEVMANIFNIFAVCGVLFFLLVVYSSIFQINWNVEAFQFVFQIVILILLSGMTLSMSLLFRAIANEIKAEKDRNYITTLFSGFVGFASLIVAVVALFKGVG